MSLGRSLLRLPSNLAVSAYLGGVAAMLVVRGKLPVPKLGKLVLSRLRPKSRGSVANPVRERGFCFVANLPAQLVSDSDGGSRLIVYEDDVPLPYPHANHDAIRNLGSGRYSHWGAALYFSASDNSDPTRNGRSYRFEEQ